MFNFSKNAAGFETAKQLIKSAGSVGANYSAACRAKSTANFIYKIKVIIEEADESLYWLEITKDTSMVPSNQFTQLDVLIKEANELASIFNAADITAKKNRDLKNRKITKSQNQK